MSATMPGSLQIPAFLVAEGLVADPASVRLEPLAGGVSSDIWLVTAGTRTLVVKQPLLQLKVADDWQAPLSRSHSEARWLEEVSRLVPGACPRVLAFDPVANVLVLEYLDPDAHTLWKADLMAGRLDLVVASAVGDRLGTIHELTSADPGLAEEFANDDLFVTLRIEPYLLRLVHHHPELADPVAALVDTTMSQRSALVHGDASPKNILIGPDGPVFLDAETAWWGDPAFDVAFCLNHLLLKSLLPGAPVDALLASVDALVSSYVAHVSWEDSAGLLQRVAALVPALLLARVDGRSPVEYLGEAERAFVRAFALPRIVHPPATLVEITSAWKESLA